MIKKISIIFFCILQSYFVMAKKVEGQIILQNDTLNVVLDIPVKLISKEIDYLKLQKKVKYYSASGKKMSFKPNQIVELRFKYDNENIRMISVPRKGDLYALFKPNPNVLLKLEIDGKLRMFSYYYYKQSSGVQNTATGMSTTQYTYSTDNYLLLKENGQVKWPKNYNFKKDILPYFSDCPELLKKIESKEFKKENLDLIVNFYNENCGQ